MEWVRSYILTITAAGILCAIVKNLSDGRAGGRMLGFTCGVFLILAAISPLHTVDFSGWDENLECIQSQASAVQEQTTEKIQSQLDAIILERTTAYILDKGAALGAALEVEVSLGRSNGYGIPESVCISGAYSPYIKTQLGAVLEQDLGIPPERQEWN